MTESKERPVVFAYNGGIGDRLCNLPALRALAKLFEGRLTLIASSGDRRRYYSDLALYRVVELELRGLEHGWAFDVRPLLRNIEGCDLFLSINPWHTDSVSELLAGLPPETETLGFFPEFRTALSCDYVGHAIDMAFDVPRALDSTLRLEEYSAPPQLSSEALATARRVLANTEQRILFVHTDTKPDKRWDGDRFNAVLDRFLERHRDFTALVVDVRHEQLYRGRFHDRVLNIDHDLDVTFALVSLSAIFLGIDSCFLHAADLFRVPGVALFGPTTCERWGFKFSRHWHLQSPDAVLRISVDDVYAVLSDLASPRTRSLHP